jgi:uncharacterized RDD family membrane protein YckC
MTVSDPPDDRREDPASLPRSGSPNTCPESPRATGPPVGALPVHDENPLGRRVGAALIDMVLLAGLLVIMGLTVGQHSAGGGGFSVSLSPAWALAYLALLLAYYFALETTTGQTVGKRLLGLQVVRADGSRPSAWAISARTLLRIIDWLPLLYLAGFITMLATGRRQQRLGDLAAGTAVARALPARHRGLALVPLAVVLAAAAGLSASFAASAGGPRTYQAHGVSFDYPAGWQPVTTSGISFRAQFGRAALWSAALAFGPDDAIIAAAYPAPPPAASLAAFTPAFGLLLRQVIAQAAWAMQAGPDRTRMGGMPALVAWATGPAADGTPAASTFVFAFTRTTEYEIDCQHTQENAVQVAQACGQVTRTFTVSALASRPGAAPLISPQEFAAKASAVCARADRQVPPAPGSSSSPSEAAKDMAGAARWLDNVIAGFGALETPDSWQYPFGEFLARLGQVRDDLGKLDVLARQADAAGFNKEFGALMAVASRSNRVDDPWLGRHGMSACANLGILH